MRSSVTKTFRKKLNELPISVQEQAAKTYRLWQKSPYHPSLQFKRVSQRQPIYSVRIKRVSQRQPIYSVRISHTHQVLGLLEADRIYWFWIGKHDEYDDLLKRI